MYDAQWRKALTELSELLKMDAADSPSVPKARSDTVAPQGAWPRVGAVRAATRALPAPATRRDGARSAPGARRGGSACVDVAVARRTVARWPGGIRACVRTRRTLTLPPLRGCAQGVPGWTALYLRYVRLLRDLDDTYDQVRHTHTPSAPLPRFRSFRKVNPLGAPR
jgi:hypothetical protein